MSLSMKGTGLGKGVVGKEEEEEKKINGTFFFAPEKNLQSPHQLPFPTCPFPQPHPCLHPPLCPSTLYLATLSHMNAYYLLTLC